MIDSTRVCARVCRSNFKGIGTTNSVIHSIKPADFSAPNLDSTLSCQPGNEQSPRKMDSHGKDVPKFGRSLPGALTLRV